MARRPPNREQNAGSDHAVLAAKSDLRPGGEAHSKGGQSGPVPGSRGADTQLGGERAAERL
jgi:hypothetical protein